MRGWLDPGGENSGPFQSETKEGQPVRKSARGQLPRASSTGFAR